MLNLIKHYFKLYIFVAGSFGIFCFTAQGVAQSVPALTGTFGTVSDHERTMSDKAVFTAIECNTAKLKIPVSAASVPIPATTTLIVEARKVTGLQEQTVPTTTLENQTTSVLQLTDVQPTDWAFQALQSLVERYGVVVGHFNSADRGNRAMTRDEFAARINAALKKVDELIAARGSDLVAHNDLVTLQRLQAEFATELAILQNRVDPLKFGSPE